MAAKLQAPSAPRSSLGGKAFAWITGLVCFGFLGFMLVSIVHQIVVPPPAHRLVLIQDIPLPSALGATSTGQTNPLAAGVAQDFDHFDFQAYDAATQQLFIAHTGPNPDRLALAHTKFDPKFDGHIIVFNTHLERITSRIDIPQVAV